MPRKKDNASKATTDDKGGIELDPFLGSFLGVDYIPKLASEDDNDDNKTEEKTKTKEPSPRSISKTKRTVDDTNNNKNDLEKADARQVPQDIPTPKQSQQPQLIEELLSLSSSSANSFPNPDDKNDGRVIQFHDDPILDSAVFTRWCEQRKSKRPGFKYYSGMSFVCLLWLSLLLFFCSEGDIPSSASSASSNANAKLTIQSHATYFSNNDDNYDNGSNLNNLTKMLQGMSQVMVVGIHNSDGTTPNTVMNYSGIHCTKTSNKKFFTKDKDMGIVTYNDEHAHQLVEVQQLFGDEWKCTVSSSSTATITNDPWFFSDSTSPTLISSYKEWIRNHVSDWGAIMLDWKEMNIQKFLASSIITVIDFIPPNESFEEEDILADAIFRLL